MLGKNIPDIRNQQMITIITINYNLSAETIPCVNSILHSSYNDFSILLIDNGSKVEDYQKLMQYYKNEKRVEILRIDKNVGYVEGVNHGLKHALTNEAAYFMIMNNDTILDKDAIHYLVEAAKRHNNKAIVSGKVYYYDNPDVLQHTGVIFIDQRYLKTAYPGKNEKDIGQFEKEEERDSLDDVFWLLPKNLVKDVGFYSEYFFLYAEQGDYAQRAGRKGYKLIFTTKAKIWHKESLTTGGGNTKSLPVCYWRGQGQFVFAFRNLKRKYFFISISKKILKLLVSTIINNTTKRKCAIATLRGYLWGLKWLFIRKPNDGKNPYVKS